MDRYLMICHPFVAKRMCTGNTPKLTILLIFLLSAIYNIPRLMEYRTSYLDLPNTENDHFHVPEDLRLIVKQLDLKTYREYLTPFGKSAAYRIVYLLWSWIILVVVIPFSSIAIMNAFLIREVRMSAKRGHQINKHEQRRQDTNMMLIGVVVIFFMCQVPAAVSHILWDEPVKIWKKANLWIIINEIGNMMIIVNSAINIIPYYVFGRRFRQEFFKLFCRYLVMNRRRGSRGSLANLNSNETLTMLHPTFMPAEDNTMYSPQVYPFGSEYYPNSYSLCRNIIADDYYPSVVCREKINNRRRSSILQFNGLLPQSLYDWKTCKNTQPDYVHGSNMTIQFTKRVNCFKSTRTIKSERERFQPATVRCSLYPIRKNELYCVFTNTTYNTEKYPNENVNNAFGRRDSIAQMRNIRRNSAYFKNFKGPECTRKDGFLSERFCKEKLKSCDQNISFSKDPFSKLNIIQEL